MIDAVLSYHANPHACGVTKFNHRLARECGVEHGTLTDWSMRGIPLLSLKAVELASDLAIGLSRYPEIFDVLWHDGGLPDITRRARRVFYADALGCPSTVDGNPTRGAYRVLTFGMAHKRLLHHYEALKVQLDAEHADYTVEMSTAIHEGTPWDDGHAQSISDMRSIFGSRFRALGFLGDDALAKELRDVDAVAVYFDPAFRANNTSAWAAIEAGKTLYTNRDEHSPDVSQPPTWAKLIETLQGIPCAK